MHSESSTSGPTRHPAPGRCIAIQDQCPDQTGSAIGQVRHAQRSTRVRPGGAAVLQDQRRLDVDMEGDRRFEIALQSCTFHPKSMHASLRHARRGGAEHVTAADMLWCTPVHPPDDCQSRRPWFARNRPAPNAPKGSRRRGARLCSPARLRCRS